MKWFVKCIKNYVNFTGRARRKEFWYFMLCSFIIAMVLTLIDRQILDYPVSVLTSLYGLFIFLPQLAVMVRRLHDTGRSGKLLLWYYLAAVIWVIALVVTGISAFAGLMQGSLDGMSAGFMLFLFGGLLVFLVWQIMFLVWFCTRGTDGDNKYGPDPLKEAE